MSAITAHIFLVQRLRDLIAFSFGFLHLGFGIRSGAEQTDPDSKLFQKERDRDPIL